MLRFTHRAAVILPSWADNLRGFYYFVRVEGRDKAKRMRYYRKIRKERLMLLESGVPDFHIDAVCKYLVSLKEKNATKALRQLSMQPYQLTLF